MHQGRLPFLKITVLARFLAAPQRISGQN